MAHLWVGNTADGHQYCEDWDWQYCTDPQFRYPTPGSPFFNEQLVQASEAMNLILRTVQDANPGLELRICTVPEGVMLMTIDPGQPVPDNQLENIVRGNAAEDKIVTGLGLAPM